MNTLSLALLLLQQAAAAQAPLPTGSTSPRNGDTTGYWQQRVHYTIVATLDETQQKLRARGEMVYVNRSPDTLKEMYVHQHLNAFRPGSKWAAVDEREGRVRFQSLRDPDHAYERFTNVPTFDGVAVRPEYPGSPDSTVARFALPKWLLPGDSIRVVFEWEARPSTLPRRQGRRGRTWDFAQWYPKVAVYDGGKWQPNALQPAGEFYGEFGTYDVTLVVRDDQVLGATGVPVEGDPGWERVRRSGEARLANAAYDVLPAAPSYTVPEGHRAVRFYAENVHHFGWSASPDYRYEGGVYVRPSAAPMRFRTWDTVSVHALFKPGDDTTWGGGRVVNRTIFALRWLESVYGPYAYPQMTVLHRIEGGGTEFPMMQMNGGPSQGLILHEGGHIWSYGILANNEWRSGWLDEGLTSYQTSWALNFTRPEQVAAGDVQPPARLPEGYRVNAVTIPPRDSLNLFQVQLDLLGRSEPIGTNSADFREFTIYNLMIYSRAELMYSQLRDAVGDTAFRSFLRDYYNRWALRHVDERAMRASAVRTSGKDLGWFFDQWVHRTGLVDYSLENASTTGAAGAFVTRATIARRGEYRHPMPVGVRTASGWTIVRGEPMLDRQTLEIRTAEQPLEVRIDPHHLTYDWDRRNDKLPVTFAGIKRSRAVFGWPFLDQSDREHTVWAIVPMAWLSEVGTESVSGELGTRTAVSLGLRARANYINNVDLHDFGVAVAAHGARGPAQLSRVQMWARTENPYLPFVNRPLMGHRLSAAFLDGIVKLDWSRRWDLSPFMFARGPRIGLTARLTGAYPTDKYMLPLEQWDDERVTELSVEAEYRPPVEPDSSSYRFTAGAAGGFAGGGGLGGDAARAYPRLEASATRVQYLIPRNNALLLRVFGGWSEKADRQRSFFASTADPFATFDQNLWRPRNSAFKREGVNVIPLGGAGLRGYSPAVALDEVIAANGEWTQRLYTFGNRSRGQSSLWVSAFGDIGFASSRHVELDGAMLADAGVGAAFRGRLYDRDVRFRLDLPVWVHQPALAGGRGLGSTGDLALRFVFSFTDFW